MKKIVRSGCAGRMRNTQRRLRREELCLLETSDIDPSRRTIRVRAETTKNRRARVLPYSVTTDELFGQYLEHRRTLGGINDMRVWLVRIAWNLAIDRRRRVRPEQFDEGFAEGLVARDLPADEALSEARRMRGLLLLSTSSNARANFSPTGNRQPSSRGSADPALDSGSELLRCHTRRLAAHPRGSASRRSHGSRTSAGRGRR